ncbi:MAG: putative glycolipid-binding domain-containing protein [Pseudomonadota bacterium]
MNDPQAGGPSFDGEALWRGVDAPWMESVRWSRDGAGRLASGMIIGLGDEPYRLIYQAQIDRYGRLRQLSVDHPWGWPEAFRIRGDGAGVWYDGLAEAVRDIEGCVDLLLGPSAFFLGLALARRAEDQDDAAAPAGFIDPVSFRAEPPPHDPRGGGAARDQRAVPDRVDGWFERLAGGADSALMAPEAIIEDPPIGTMEG